MELHKRSLFCVGIWSSSTPIEIVCLRKWHKKKQREHKRSWSRALDRSYALTEITSSGAHAAIKRVGRVAVDQQERERDRRIVAKNENWIFDVRAFADSRGFANNNII